MVMDKELIIIGASGHGKVVADIAELNGYTKISFLDDDREKIECSGYSIIGTTNEIDQYDCDVIIGIGNSKIREKLQNELEHKGFNFPVLIHPNSTIANKVRIGNGTVVMAGSVINSDTIIGRGCIINTCSSVDHDNLIGDFVHISVGAHLAGTVKVGDGTWVGIGSVVSNNITICNDCMIGAGTTVIRDINLSGTYLGVPARKIK